VAELFLGLTGNSWGQMILPYSREDLGWTLGSEAANSPQREAESLETLSGQVKRSSRGAGLDM